MVEFKLNANQQVDVHLYGDDDEYMWKRFMLLVYQKAEAIGADAEELLHEILMERVTTEPEDTEALEQKLLNFFRGV
jgi:hypothetical protein